MNNSPYITRKGIAILLEMSTDAIRHNEKKWKLVRLSGFTKPIRYNREKAVKCLESAGLMP